MFLKKAKKIFGLDIGTNSIKLISLESMSGIVYLDNFIIEKAQKNNREALKEQIRKLNIGKEQVNISVSGPNVLVRYLTFPKLSEAELKNALTFEVEKHIPFPVNEVYLDSFILKDTVDKKMLVLVAAVKKTLVDERVKFAQDLGLNLGVIDVDCAALINSFNYFNKESIKESIALLNIGADISNLVIIEDGKPEFSRDIMAAGNIFTQGISEKLGLSIEQAEELKYNPKDQAEKMNIALEPIIQAFCSEIRNSFDYYESQTHSVIKKIFISGGGANFRGIDGVFQNFLGIQTFFWPNIETLKFKEGIDIEKFMLNKNSFLLSLGLALRGL